MPDNLGGKGYRGEAGCACSGVLEWLPRGRGGLDSRPSQKGRSCWSLGVRRRETEKGRLDGPSPQAGDGVLEEVIRPGREPLTGLVKVDETYIGGDFGEQDREYRFARALACCRGCQEKLAKAIKQRRPSRPYS